MPAATPEELSVAANISLKEENFLLFFTTRGTFNMFEKFYKFFKKYLKTTFLFTT